MLRSMKSNLFEDAYVCRETIYNAIYALPVGQLLKELIQLPAPRKKYPQASLWRG